MRDLTWRLLALATFAVTAAGLAVPPVAASAWGQFPPGQWSPTRQSTLFVSNSSPDGHSQFGPSCQSPNFSTIEAAVSAAAPGSKVIVCPGTYDEGVAIEKRLSLIGLGAVIDASSSSTGNGVQIVGPGGSGSSVVGFHVQNAEFEGILVGTAPVAPTETKNKPTTSGQPVSKVTIAGNVVVENDKGFKSDFGQCASTPQAPGDCGEAIHLVAVTEATVEGNYVAHNAGGILLTDEFGPTSGNTIRFNDTNHNETDCGITLAGHSSRAVDPETDMPTGKAGVFDNLVENNLSLDNGVLGQGAGILMGGGGPFTGVYGNLIAGNYASGNGLAGITIHQHLVGDLNGNLLEHNGLGENNLDGDFDFKAAQDTETTGILVASGEPPEGPEGPLPAFLRPAPLKGTVIRGNFIGQNKIGIWTLNVDPATTTISGNFFGPGVTTPVSSN